MSITPTPHAPQENRARASSHLTILSQRTPNVGCREGEHRVVIYAIILIAAIRFDRQPGARAGLEGFENLLRPSARNPLQPHPEIDCQQPDRVRQPVVPEPDRPDLCQRRVHDPLGPFAPP